MTRRGIVKCSSLFFIVLLMCPNLIRSTAPLGKHKRYYHMRKSNDVIDTNAKFKPNDWSTNIVRQNEDEDLKGVDNEPGFDLSDDEIKKFKLWPKGIVPYYIDVLSFNDKVLRDRIRMFLNTVNSLTRLSFLEMPSPPKDDKTRWVFFVNRRGQLDCADHSILNFTNEGVQENIRTTPHTLHQQSGTHTPDGCKDISKPNRRTAEAWQLQQHSDIICSEVDCVDHVNLGYDCMSTGGELAEAVLSIVGIPPQHNAPDRDEHIKIVQENIMPEKRYLFQKLSNDQWLFHSLKYDFSSAGHYHHHKYSANGRATIEFQNPHHTDISMGDNHGFTRNDIKKLRMLYNYIVKKKENKVPECDKLFKKGNNFVKGNVSFEDPKPRKKPNKYLGLGEEEVLAHHDRLKETIEGSDSKVEGGTEPEHENNEHDEPEDENETDEPPATRKMNLKSHPIKPKYETFKKNPL